MSNHPFKDYVITYRERGLWPRPLAGKACKIKSWQTPDPGLPDGTHEEWLRKYGSHNIGLLMGTPLDDGTLLGAIDIDHDDYVPLGRTLLHNPPCGRIGKKGAVFFVRIAPGIKSQSFRVKNSDKYGQIVDCLFEGRLVVIPPSIHPDTNEPYRWIGTPLHEIDFNQLPLIGE